jgi:hypothetical protein
METLGQGPAPDQVNVYQRATDGPNLILATVGAALGAAVGALVWFLIEYYAHFQIGYIAILSGVLAGLGATKLGRGKGLAIGVLAAAFGLLGILGGSYGSFVASKGKAKTELREEVMREYPEFAQLPAEQQEEALAIGRHEIDELSYIDYMTGENSGLVFMILFGGFGLFYGFRAGAGGFGGSEEATV